MAASSYAAVSDMAAYLPNLDQAAETSILTSFLSAASRFIDLQTGQSFYNDGFSTKYFDGDGGDYLDLGKWPVWSKSGTIAACGIGAATLAYTRRVAGSSYVPAANDQFVLDNGAAQETVTVQSVTGSADPYTLTLTGITGFGHAAGTIASTTQVKLAYFENQPLAQWLGPLPGDGYTPVSNYWMVPKAPQNAGSTSDLSALRPWFGVELASIPVPGTNYLPAWMPGKNTASIGGFWGWPAVPDQVKHITCKMVARAFADRRTGWTGIAGSSETGLVRLLGKYFDEQDYLVLEGTDLVVWSQG